ncbi:hypothetical protein [Brevibacterium aurantiacum]|uniref:hypothetical protein n=1 Tax=Brevibacterium aurantiacum TaxID=273384 RepID=UPI00164327A5|nr:hypothetical protein [Brevibacterium aurantiacum]
MDSNGELVVATQGLDIEGLSTISVSRHDNDHSRSAFIVVEVDLADILVLSRRHRRNH